MIQRPSSAWYMYVFLSILLWELCEQNNFNLGVLTMKDFPGK